MPSIASSIAIFAHELREPLASILLAAQAACETVDNDRTNRDMWGVVERQSRYLARIIERGVELGRGSQEKTALSKEWFDLAPTILNAVEVVKSLLIERGHRLTVSLPPAPVFVLADALRIQQVVVNLLANAAKYTECGGRINVCLEEVDGRIAIEVRDSGVGISPELLPHVFDLFRQGAKSSGLGVGLALVKSLVELHGGKVSAQSGGPGTGSTFVVLLPQAGSGLGKQPANAEGTYGRPTAVSAWADNVMLDA